MKKNLLILTALLIASIGSSQTVGDLFTENFIDYQVISITPNEVRIEDYDTNGGTTVNIPATIINAGTTYNVTEIYQVSFFNKGLTSLILPNTITSIGVAAFTTNNLTNITIPNSVITIGASSFQNNQITDVIIPSSVTSIGESAFTNNPLVTVSSGAITPPVITTGGSGDSFNSNRSGIDLIVPTGTTAAYTAANWTGFNSVTEDALSVSDFELANDIKVITIADGIEIIASNSVQLQNYTIYSISGAKVATGSESEISTSFLANGIYVLKLDFNQGTVVKKFVVN